MQKAPKVAKDRVKKPKKAGKNKRIGVKSVCPYCFNFLFLKGATKTEDENEDAKTLEVRSKCRKDLIKADTRIISSSQKKKW